MNIIDGKAISKQIKDEVKEKVAALKAQGVTVTLAVVQVGNDPASSVYVNNKKKACAYTGMESESFELPEETTQEELLSLKDRLLYQMLNSRWMRSVCRILDWLFLWSRLS